MPRWTILAFLALLCCSCHQCQTEQPVYRIDVNTRLHPYSYDQMLRLMDDTAISRTINLDGGPPGEILAMLVELGELSHSRILVLTSIDWRDVDAPDFGSRAARNLERAVALGARGIVVGKELGLDVTTEDNRLLTVDDSRLDPLWAKAAELKVPVWLHTADPAPYFQPVNKGNPRYRELKQLTNRSYLNDRFPKRQELLMERDLVLARHPRTTFICTGFASSPGDPAGVDALLDLFPNVYIDTATALSDLGNHPTDAIVAFFTKHKRRILFGSGLKMNNSAVELGSPANQARSTENIHQFFDNHWRYFETSELDIPNPIPVHADTELRGLALSRHVLRAVYHQNAERLLGLAEISHRYHNRPRLQKAEKRPPTTPAAKKAATKRTRKKK